VWVQPTASATQSTAIGHELLAYPYIKSCVHRSQAYDYNEAKTILPADELQATTMADYPSSYRCVLTDPSQAPAVYQQFTGKPGVRTVSYPGQQIKTMQNVIHVLQWVFLSVAVVLLLSASVLILNTIRMAIFARRREVSVMKLVGATNWFIRVPYMSEGLIQGLLGSAVSAVAVYILYLFINHAGGNNSSSNVFSAMHMTGWEVFSTDIVVIFVGVLIGSLGSAIAIRRFLDV